MTTAIAKVAPIFQATELIPHIDRLHSEILGHVRASLTKAREAGEALIRLKEACKHGQFEQTVESQCTALSARTARTYMSIAGGWDLIMEQVGPGQASQLTITEGIRLLCKPKKAKAAEPADFPLSGEGNKRIYEVLSEGQGCSHGGQHEYDDEACVHCHNPKPDSIKVAAEPAHQGGLSLQAKNLLVRAEGIYDVLLGLLEELREAAPLPETVILTLKDSHAEFDDWRETL